MQCKIKVGHFWGKTRVTTIFYLIIALHNVNHKKTLGWKYFKPLVLIFLQNSQVYKLNYSTFVESGKVLPNLGRGFRSFLYM